MRRSRRGRESMRHRSRPRGDVTNRNRGKIAECPQDRGRRAPYSRPMPYRVHGMMQSYFTRKMTGYLDHKGIPWLFRRFPGASPEAMVAGFPGGVPVVQTPAGEFMWDSTFFADHVARAGSIPDFRQ